MKLPILINKKKPCVEVRYWWCAYKEYNCKTGQQPSNDHNSCNWTRMINEFQERKRFVENNLSSILWLNNYCQSLFIFGRIL